MLFDGTYFEKSNIIKKSLISSQDKIIMKFGRKKGASLVFGQVYENFSKIKKKVLFYESNFEVSNIN